MSKPSPRAIPRQSRSQQTVDHILNTAAVLFVEVGYDNTTTNAVAERAGISIGALYRYFPDKDALLKSLAERYYRQQHQLSENILVDDLKYLPPALVLDRIIDPILELHCCNPAYAHILLGSDVSADIAAAACGSEAEINEGNAQFFRLLNPRLGMEQSLLAAVVCKASLKSLISLVVASTDEQYRRQVTIEFKKMILAYLLPILWPDAASPSS
jgi:AcrR family transcriptional regulator